MTQALSSQSLPLSQTAPSPRRLSWAQQYLPLAALGTLFWLTLRQHARGRRLLVFAFLFSLPTVVVVLVQTLDPLVSAFWVKRALLPMLLPGPSIPPLGLLEV